MASLHTHRKLLIANPPNSNSDTNSPPDKDPTVQTCLYFCNLQRNNSSASTGFCPQACLAICPSVCQYSLSNVPFPPTSIPNKSQNLSPLLLCMLILLAVTFLMIALYVLYTKLYYHYYAPNSNSFLQTRTRRRRGESAAGSYSVDEEHRNRVVFHPFWCIPTVGLPPAEIHSIPIHKYGKEMEQRDCVVCLAEFEEGDELRVLSKCNHAFHIPCIDTWLSSHTTCPLCRSPIIPPDDHDHDYDRDNDQDHNHKDEDTSTSLTSVEGATENNYPAEVLGITITGREEEVENNTEDADHTEDTQNKDQKNLGRVDQGSSSQRWSLERGAANLLSRSLSCSGKIFSSRSNIRPNPNS